MEQIQRTHSDGTREFIVMSATTGESLLDRALADLAEHPDSTARQIAQRIGADDRDLFDMLDRAAYAGKVQRWREAGARSAWRWEIPGTPRRCTKCARSAGELTENGCPDHGDRYIMG